MFTANANGSPVGASIWNTRGGDNTYNIYMFTGTVASPSFLNSGNSDALLNPNLELVSGVYTVQFTGETAPGGSLGINLYFNNNPSNRIAALVAIDGSSNFSVIPAGVPTFGLDGSQPRRFYQVVIRP